MTDGVTERQAKYRRLLPRLVLGRTLYTRGTLTVYCREPFDDLCDVTLRVVDAEGRTHAERSVTFDAESRPVSLGGTVNLPPGCYDVLATPPLSQFWSGVPVEHRMPLTVAPRLCDEEAEDPASRAAAVRVRRVVQNPASAWPDLLDAVDPERGDAFAVLVRRRLTAAEPIDGDALAASWARVGTAGGIDVTGSHLQARVVALAALAATLDGDPADWALAQLDAHAFALALACVGGLPIVLPATLAASADAHAALAWYLWGRGVAAAAAPAVQALALAGYVPPPVLGVVARAADAQDVLLTPPGQAGLSLWREGEIAVASSGSTWLSALAPDVRVVGTGAVRVSRDGAVLAAQYAGPATLAVPLWALEDLRQESNLVTGRCRDLAFAIASTAPLRRDPAAPESGLLSEGAAQVVCIAGPAIDGLLGAARDRLGKPWPAIESDRAAAWAIDSPYGRAATEAQNLTIRTSDAMLSLDLSVPQAAADGAVL